MFWLRSGSDAITDDSLIERIDGVSFVPQYVDDTYVNSDGEQVTEQILEYYSVYDGGGDCVNARAEVRAVVGGEIMVTPETNRDHGGTGTYTVRLTRLHSEPRSGGGLWRGERRRGRHRQLRRMARDPANRCGDRRYRRRRRHRHGVARHAHLHCRQLGRSPDGDGDRHLRRRRRRRDDSHRPHRFRCRLRGPHCSDGAHRGRRRPRRAHVEQRESRRGRGRLGLLHGEARARAHCRRDGVAGARRPRGDGVAEAAAVHFRQLGQAPDGDGGLHRRRRPRRPASHPAPPLRGPRPSTPPPPPPRSPSPSPTTRPPPSPSATRASPSTRAPQPPTPWCSTCGRPPKCSSG